MSAPFAAPEPAPAEPVDVGAVLLGIYRYLAHIDAVVFEQTRMRKYVSEEGVSYGDSGSLNLVRQSTNPIRVTHLLVSSPAATVLSIEQAKLSFVAGTTSIPCSLILRPSVPVVLSTADGNPAPLCVILMGEEYPTNAYSSGVIGG